MEKELAQGSASPPASDLVKSAHDIEGGAAHHESFQNEEINNLSEEHRQYLLHRHGTLNLDPIPDMDDADPYNWPSWKKGVNLALVAFHAMMGTFTAACIMAAFENIHLDLGVSLQRASYLTSLVIAILGGAPLFWRPLANRFGRRPIFLISLICALVAEIGCANSYSYATMGLCRAIAAWFICPPAAIGSAVVAEMFFKKDRARCMGYWTLMVTLGVPSAPFLMGFVAQRVGYRWIYYIMAVVHAIQLIVYFAFGAETLYMRKGTGVVQTQQPTGAIKREYFKFGRIDSTPLTWFDFVEPLTLAAKPCVMIPAAAYAMIFLWGSIMVTVEIPQLYPVMFGLDTQEVGLQFIAVILGSVLGEQVGGLISDRWMAMSERKHGVAPPREHRLWLAYIGHALTICGVVVFAIQIKNAGAHWNVTPAVGAAIAAAGNQIVTTINVTYAVDCYRPQAASVGVFITFVRQVWGFIGPFWFPQMFDTVGFAGGAGVAIALMVGVSVIPTIILQWKGKNWH
ncbi:hypothetical protein ASPZODRAFT_161530 [Penicilliopsis zonata CBS 506.65]|uniref:Major facilitator superfamily (MFS) profile domain-containing protein n=1 Tax=Penicilliopsis zonata CBS 506.65 TaxID=1073090 RepID=A0A1L9S924_9EURO|nr:hypothetical protein ASPZODRAFT_161530 [Penicilliopsis zonata CBS 506.65]OJJ43656.1 hypothetical protein ASPZODRAFT_161530 [Penicilliopsis zonata CBS 506.65]